MDWLGSINVEFCEVGMKRMIDFRAGENDRRFFDIHFSDFQGEPFGVIESILAYRLQTSWAVGVDEDHHVPPIQGNAGVV